MTASRISVSRVLELDVPFSWQEAVAIVGEVAALRVAGPALDGHIRIEADSCLLTAGGAVELPRSSVEPAEDAEVQLLRALLVGRDIPDDLEALAYGPAPAHLGDALAVFSRPDRRSAIAGVAVRGLEAEAELAAFARAQVVNAPDSITAVLHAPVEGFDELRAQVAHGPDPATSRPPAPPAAAAARPSGFRTGTVAAAVAVLTTVAVGVWAWSAWRPTTPAQSGTTADTLPAVQSRPSWQETGLRSGDIELPRARAGRVAPPVPGAAPNASSASPELTTLATEGQEAWATISAPAAGATSVAPSAPASEAVNAPAVTSADDSVYSRRNTEVRPATMRFPRMPRSAFPAPDAVLDGQYVEVLVDKAGAVEAVRLRGRPAPGEPGLRYSMILAAAKVWQFMPATLDGRPVRYVARMVLEP